MVHKIKNIFKTQYKLTAGIFLLLSTLLFALLLSNNIYAESYLSTGFIPSSVVGFLKNSLVAFLFYQFGIAIYLIPLTFFIWSYRAFFNKKIGWIKLRLILLLLCVSVFTVICNMTGTFLQGGVVGSYLTHNLFFIQDYRYYFAILVTGILLFLFAISVTPKELFSCLELIFFIIYIIVQSIVNLFLKTFDVILGGVRQKFYNKGKAPPEETRLSKAFAAMNKDVLTKHDWSLQNTSTKSEEAEFSNSNYQYNSDQYNSDSSGYSRAKDKYVANTKTATMSKDASASVNSPFHFHVKKDSNYKLPVEFLQSKEERTQINNAELKQTAIKLERVIKEFGIEAKIVGFKTGPVVTLFEITIPPGVKTAKLINLEADIALRMKAFSARIAVVPGKDVIGIEIPNAKRKTVYLRSLIEHKVFVQSDCALPLNLGLDIGGKPIVADLATMPHLLVAGTTGSGKSVAVNGMILSLLYKLSPERCKMIMIDPKMLELSIYQDIPHLLTPVVTDPKKAIYALKWAVKQMEHRYSLMSYLGVRNIGSYNQKLKDTAFVNSIKEELLENEGYETQFNFMPYIIVVIDEMADLMLVAGKEIEALVQRLAQMARAAGIHLIMATQRPSVDVITGTIKANFPTRISFQVSSRIDSTTILGDKGAEQLLGKGDMLYMQGVGRLLRVHGPFVSDNEVDRVVSALKKLSKPEYIESVTEDKETQNSTDNAEIDELYQEVVQLIQQEQRVSTSFIQRKFQIGYNRAARIIEQLEDNGVISKATATGKREILI